MTIRTDRGTVAVARKIDTCLAEIASLIHSIEESKHPHAQEMAEDLRDQCYAPAWAVHVIHKHLEHPEQWETNEQGIQRTKKKADGTR